MNFKNRTAIITGAAAGIGRATSIKLAENANLICFLASYDSSYIAGQNIQIDGCRKKQ